MPTVMGFIQEGIVPLVVAEREKVVKVLRVDADDASTGARLTAADTVI